MSVNRGKYNSRIIFVWSGHTADPFRASYLVVSRHIYLLAYSHGGGNSVPYPFSKSITRPDRGERESERRGLAQFAKLFEIRPSGTRSYNYNSNPVKFGARPPILLFPSSPYGSAINPCPTFLIISFLVLKRY